MALGTSQMVAFVAASLLAGALGVGALQQGSRPSEPRPTADEAAETAAPMHHHEDAAAAGIPLDVLTPRGFDAAKEPKIVHTPPFPVEAGKVPTLAEAKEFSKKYSRFVAKGDEGIQKLRAEGHLQGDGTPQAPYVLEKFYVEGELSLTSLHKAIIVRDGYVGGQFKLNYIGEQVYVHHVYAKDLRINENVQRNGSNTGGLFHDNQFGFVGQIRHYVGEFRNNQIGPKPGDVITEYLADAGVAKVDPAVVFNFDGFHTADVHHNRFLGEVDIKLHGHNHADCFTCPVHDHHDKAEFPHEGETVDAHGFMSRHSVRYVSLLFRDNEIVVPGGIALRYNDRNHAGDDRTANSEPNPHLNDDHVHFQDITIRGNHLMGGYLLVDVFNAADERHSVQNRGILRITGNLIETHYRVASGEPTTVAGLRGQSADGLELRLEGNTVRFVDDGAGDPKSIVAGAGRSVELRGIQWDAVDAANLTIKGNTVESGKYGMYVTKFTGAVAWWLSANDFRTAEAWRGKDIANPPRED